MAITTQREFWEIIEAKLPRGRWVPFQDAYALVERNVTLQPDDFLPAAPMTDDPKWNRNVRNVLQRRKTKGEIERDRAGKYMI